ncbi:MAG: PrgI family protein [Enterocloster bolteae]
MPKDLSGIKTKVALNLNQKTDYLFFSGAAVAGVPSVFPRQKGWIRHIRARRLSMVGAMLPFFFLAMYEKDGFPAEKILYFMLRQKVLTPGIRPYRSENLYEQLEETGKITKGGIVILEEQSKKAAAGKPKPQKNRQTPEKAGLTFSEKKRLVRAVGVSLSGNRQRDRRSRTPHRKTHYIRKDVPGRHLSGGSHRYYTKMVEFYDINYELAGSGGSGGHPGRNTAS